VTQTATRLVVAVFVCVFAAFSAAAQARQGQSVDPALKKAADARSAASNANNPDAFTRDTLADAYIASPEGLALTVQDRMAATKGAKPSQLEMSEERFRLFGETAIRTYRVDGTNGQGQKVAQRRLEVWTKQNGEWKEAAVQVTNIAKP